MQFSSQLTGVKERGVQKNAPACAEGAAEGARAVARECAGLGTAPGRGRRERAGAGARAGAGERECPNR